MVLSLSPMSISRHRQPTRGLLAPIVAVAVHFLGPLEGGDRTFDTWLSEFDAAARLEPDRENARAPAPMGGSACGE